MEAAARDRNLLERAARERLEPSRREDDRGLLAVQEPRRLVERRRLPRSQALGGEIREGGRVSREVERLARHDARRLVLPVAVAGRAGEDRDDDLRAEAPDDAHRVLEQGLLRPEPQRLVERLREPEVVGAREELAREVEAARGRELLGPQEAQTDAELVADQVLPAVAPRERQVRGLAAHPPRHEGQESGVLVVGMRRDDEEAPVRRELAQEGIERVDPSRGGRGKLCRRRLDGGSRRGR
ncbi:MAG TPA: hypothetical protein VIW03_15940, partial [Anaeromyxobacter sp.]